MMPTPRRDISRTRPQDWSTGEVPRQLTDQQMSLTPPIMRGATPHEPQSTEGGMLSRFVESALWAAAVWASFLESAEGPAVSTATTPPDNRFALAAALLKVCTPESAFRPPLEAQSLRQSYQPRTKLGQRLWELRSKIVASGANLLSWDEIEEEVADRREGAGSEEK